MKSKVTEVVGLYYKKLTYSIVKINFYITNLFDPKEAILCLECSQSPAEYL